MGSALRAAGATRQRSESLPAIPSTALPLLQMSGFLVRRRQLVSPLHDSAQPWATPFGPLALFGNFHAPSGFHEMTPATASFRATSRAEEYLIESYRERRRQLQVEF